ncbi:hypothetical protein I4U23_009882 [Adineta vaga]|nr:hypothetical protein I4U23_009882 [Adineta vaga]
MASCYDLAENYVVQQNNENCEQKDATKKRIFIPTIGTLGDVKPFLILAQELKKRGYLVRMAVHKRFQDIVTAAGIDTIEMGGDMELVLSSTPEGMDLRRNPSLFKISALKTVYSLMFEDWFKTILSALGDTDLIVLSVGSLLAGLSCLDKFPNVKAIAIYTFPISKTAKFSPPGIGSDSESLFSWINALKWKMFRHASLGMHSSKVNHLRADIGLPPLTIDHDQMIEHIFHKPLKAATIYSKYLLPRPSDWQANEYMVGPILDEIDDQFEPSTTIMDFLNKWKNEKIIYVGLGSMLGVMLNVDEQIKFLNDIQSAILNNNCCALISLIGSEVSDSQKFINDERVLYLRQSVPHSWLFSKISAAIHHGGAGTTHISIRYGLPTFILPIAADQPFNGDRIFINKLGPKPIPVRQTNQKNLTAAIHDLTSKYYNIYAMNAQRVGELIKKEDGLGHCIRLIEAELNNTDFYH